MYTCRGGRIMAMAGENHFSLRAMIMVIPLGRKRAYLQLARYPYIIMSPAAATNKTNMRKRLELKLDWQSIRSNYNCAYARLST